MGKSGLLGNLTVDKKRRWLWSPREGVVHLKVHLHPCANRHMIGDVDLWRNMLNIYVRGRAQRGEANRDLIAYVSKILDINEGSVILQSGESQRDKLLTIKGLDQDKVRAILLGRRNER